MKRKRYRKPVAREGEVKIGYGYEGGQYSLVYAWGPGLGKSNVIPLMNAFERIAEVPWARGRTLLQDLEDDGFDITTLKFSIQKKVTHEEE